MHNIYIGIYKNTIDAKKEGYHGERNVLRKMLQSLFDRVMQLGVEIRPKLSISLSH